MAAPDQNNQERRDDSGSNEDEVIRPEIQEETGDGRTNLHSSSEHLLDRLLYKGVLPRYAFPTDVTTFYIFDQARYTKFNPRFEFTPSQSLPVALSQYAPGKTICVSDKFYTSSAIYAPQESERDKAWNKRRLYYECQSCGFAKTMSLTEGNINQEIDCAACNKSTSMGPAKHWLIPPGFAHAIDIDPGTTSDYEPERSYPTAAKLTVPAVPDQWIEINDFLRVYHTRENLLVTNKGPRGDGYTYCLSCGRIESNYVSHFVTSAHTKPFPDTNGRCPRSKGIGENLVLGTEFISDVLLISIRVKPPLQLEYFKSSTKVALRTLSEALKKASCLLLELEQQELEAEFRIAFTEEGRENMEVEIYIYDTLPGGAGFTKQICDLGIDVFKKALEVLTECPEGCDSSCYRCLRSFNNKFHHNFLNRDLGASLLNYLLESGNEYIPDQNRLKSSAKLLYEDLRRQCKESVITLDKTISPAGYSNLKIPIHISNPDGQEAAVIICDSLTPDTPPNDQLSQFLDNPPGSVIPYPVDELEVKNLLPQISSKLINDLSMR